jgi:APA family basic amino acid/polyamine antiporter
VTTLDRRLGVRDAVVLGLGSMLGAGVFVVFAPAVAAAGGAGLLGALAIAGVVAFCNATSAARLAARYPESGGSYVYGRERLGEFAGYLAGWGFVAGKTASCAAMALTVGLYAEPALARPIGIATVVALTVVNLLGVTKTARTNRWLVGLTLFVLAVVVGVGLVGGHPQASGLTGVRPGGTLTAAGLLFFAFAGYARIATLGEEVREPERTIPRAVPVALAIVLAVYAVVAVTALTVLGPRRLAAAPAPLVEVVRAAGVPELAALVRAGAAAAVVGVLLSLLAGVARTALAMARRRDLPPSLAVIHPTRRVPHRAQLLLGAVVVTVVSLADVRGAIGFSSVTVLVYYAVTNASALTLPGRGRNVVAAIGLIGCVVLAGSLPWRSVLAGVAVLAVGALAFAVTRASGRSRRTGKPS